MRGAFVSGDGRLPAVRHEGPFGWGGADAVAHAADGRYTALWHGRLDNSRDLAAVLRADAGYTSAELALRAFLTWGEACAERLLGDWVLVVWDAQTRRLLLARDQAGLSALYYYLDASLLAFATNRKPLLALAPTPWQMDEWALAQVLTAWHGHDGVSVFQQPLRRLPPAHLLTVDPERSAVRCYWRMEAAPEREQPLPDLEGNAARLRELFDSAVRSRLAGDRPIAVSLSGGLDSGAVAATAAHWLAAEGRRLIALTAVPLTSAKSFVGERFGNEFPLAQLTAQHAGNIDLIPVDAADCTPVAGLRAGLRIFDEPVHAAQNLYWSLAVGRRAQELGMGALLSGQMGNLTVSWTGSLTAQPWWFQARAVGRREWLRDRVRRALPPAWTRAWRKRRLTAEAVLGPTAVHPDFARRIGLVERLLDDADSPFAPPARSGLEERLRGLQPGRSTAGALLADLGTAFDLEARDPTIDLRVLTFTLAVPDRLFLDPHTGVDRLLIRHAMTGRLPDFVRLNPLRGRQSGDLIPRLRASADEVEAALDEVAAGPAAGYVDLAALRAAWRLAQEQAAPSAFQHVTKVLMRGLMVGFAVNQFGAPTW